MFYLLLKPKAKKPGFRINVTTPKKLQTHEVTTNSKQHGKVMFDIALSLYLSDILRVPLYTNNGSQPLSKTVA